MTADLVQLLRASAAFSCCIVGVVAAFVCVVRQCTGGGPYFASDGFKQAFQIL